jgi:endonuclease/exonuclease/phosphatase family metal-dependent hydrolase
MPTAVISHQESGIRQLVPAPNWAHCPKTTKALVKSKGQDKRFFWCAALCSELKVRMRPSSLTPAWPTLSRAEKERLYAADAAASRPVSRLPPARPAPAALRLTQYNVQALSYNRSCAATPAATAAGIGDLLLGTGSDVLVLQEFVLSPQGAWPLDKADEPLAHGLAQRLAAGGFVHQLLALDQAYPTFVASRLPLAPLPPPAASQHKLGGLCTAVRLRVRTAGGRAVEVLGCHLDYLSAEVRLVQARGLLECMQSVDASATLLAADFNQPRQADYTAEEWGWIMAWREAQGEGASDGVHELLHGAGFACAHDAEGVDRNWPAGAPPPPTHWTGTTIDRAYCSSSSGGLACVGLYVHPSGLSDHHAVVSDWCWAEKEGGEGEEGGGSGGGAAAVDVPGA